MNDIFEFPEFLEDWCHATHILLYRGVDIICDGVRKS